MSANSSENTSSEIGLSGMAFRISSEKALWSVIPALRIKVGLVVRPLTNGFAYISNMPALSAPSAKILTLRSSTFFMFALALYDFQRFVCRRNSVVVLGGLRLFIAAIDEDGSAARSDAGFNIVPAVS